MKAFWQLSDFSVAEKRVIVREDFNVPLNEKGEITDPTRLEAALPTLIDLLQQNARVVVFSHLGSPKSAFFDPKLSLQPVWNWLKEHLAFPVHFCSDWQNKNELAEKAGELVLCENTRFVSGEKENDRVLSTYLAQKGDLYVMDAFASAHRKQASTYGMFEQAKNKCIGPLFLSEVTAIDKIFTDPKRPIVAIVGGSKVSSKLRLLHSLSQNVDYLILGGGILNTFLMASGFSVGSSLVEIELIPEAQAILASSRAQIMLAKEVCVAKALSETSAPTQKNILEVETDDRIFDIGEKSFPPFLEIIKNAQTILWNGPVGVFEIAPFAKGTEALGRAIAASQAFSIAGGGDTLSAIHHFALAEKISYLSTGGGAFLEYLEDKTLPVLNLLEKNIG